MLFAADFRRIAREALSGKWALAVGTGFIAMLLGADSSGSSGGSSSSRDGVRDYMDSLFPARTEGSFSAFSLAWEQLFLYGLL